MSGGGLFFDYDNDGWLDVFLVDGGSLADPAVGRARAAPAVPEPRQRHLRGRDGALRHRAHASTAWARAPPTTTTTAAIDLYVTNVGPNTLYHNNGGKSFTDVTRAAGVGSSSFGTSCAFADVDRDGYVDLFVTNYVDARARQQRLLRRHGATGSASTATRSTSRRWRRSSTTTTATAPSPTSARRPASPATAATASASSSATTTMTGGRISSWPTTRRRISCTTTRAAACSRKSALPAGVASRPTASPRAGMGTDFGDYDGDGRLDLFVTNHELEMHTLFRNLGRGLFADTTIGERRRRRDAAVRRLRHAVLRLRQRRRSRPRHRQRARHERLGPLPAGREGGAAQAALPQRRRRPVQGSRAARRAPGFALEGVGRTLAAGDIDNDGDLDLLVTNNGGTRRAAAQRRRTRATTRVLLRLEGTQSNRSAIGARVRLTAGGTTQIREIKAGSSYLGESDLRVHFGLGPDGPDRPDRDSLAVGRPPRWFRTSRPTRL